MRKRWAVRWYSKVDGALLDEELCRTERAAYRLVRLHQSTQTYQIIANSHLGPPYTMIVEPA